MARKLLGENRRKPGGTRHIDRRAFADHALGSLGIRSILEDRAGPGSGRAGRLSGGQHHGNVENGLPGTAECVLPASGATGALTDSAPRTTIISVQRSTDDVSGSFTQVEVTMTVFGKATGTSVYIVETSS